MADFCKCKIYKKKCLCDEQKLVTKVKRIKIDETFDQYGKTESLFHHFKMRKTSVRIKRLDLSQIQNASYVLTFSNYNIFIVKVLHDEVKRDYWVYHFTVSFYMYFSIILIVF